MVFKVSSGFTQTCPSQVKVLRTSNLCADTQYTEAVVDFAARAAVTARHPRPVGSINSNT